LPIIAESPNTNLLELAGRIIVVQAAVNGVEGNYLLDTGAPVIMLNRPVFTKGEIETRPINHPMPMGAGGAMTEVEASADLTLVWGGLTVTGQRALVADLSRLGDDNQPMESPAAVEPEQIINMEMMAHMPYIPVTIAGIDLKLGIDSGAEGAMLQTRWQEELKEHYEFLRRSEMKGADTNVPTIRKVGAASGQWATMLYNVGSRNVNEQRGAV
jgi:hypothetical protein